MTGEVLEKQGTLNQTVYAVNVKPRRPSNTYCVLLACVLVLSACGGASDVQRRGEVMGTYFVLKARCETGARQALDDAEVALRQTDAQMSTYKPDSELMQLNAHPLGDWLEVGADLAAVLELSARVARESEGAFNVASGRLIDVWGFGAQPVSGVPDAALIETLRPALEPFSTSKERLAARDADVSLNLSAVAKGYGVDQAAEALEKRCASYMVDVGGEVRVAGRNARGQPWRIGIETPSTVNRGVETVLALETGSVATSGDYRNYREVDGTRVSHTIDPRTGRPISHALASVTVVHPRCAEADAYATALNVLGPEEGFALAERLNLAAYFIERTAEGFGARYTAPMQSYLGQPR